MSGSGSEVPERAGAGGAARDSGRAVGDLVLEIALALTGTLDTQEVLALAVEKTKRLLRAQAVTLFQIDRDAGELYFDIARGGKAEQVKPCRIKMGQGIAGWVAQTGEPELVNDVRADARFFAAMDAQSGFETRSVIAVPLVVKNQVVGVLEALNPEDGGLFNGRDLDNLLVLAPHIAVALHNAHAAEELRASREAVLRVNEGLEAKVEERTEMLSRAKREWESTFDAISEPLVLLHGFVVRRGNLAFAARAGVPVTSIIGRKCHELLAGRSSPCAGCPFAEVDGTSGPWAGEVKMGEQIFQVSGFAVPSDGTRVVHYRDMSAERQMEAQLRESEKLATVGRLAAGAAHEINNPMGFLTSNLSTLRAHLPAFRRVFSHFEMAAAVAKESGPERALDALLRAADEAAASKITDAMEDAAELVDEAIGGAKRVAEIVKALKELAREEKGVAEPLDPAVCLERAAQRALKGHISPPGLALDCMAQGRISAHPLKLEQALYQIVRNAVQAVSAGGKVALRTFDREDRVVLEIEDDGCGIPADAKGRIFEPFFTTRPVGQGVGLGLTAAYGIVRQHHGTIEVHSEVGKGTRVRMAFPRLASHGPHHGPAASALEPQVD